MRGLNRNDDGQRHFIGVKLARYCEITGEKAAAVRTRICRGDWIEGVHYSRDAYGHIWVIPEGANQWIQAGSATGSKSARNRYESTSTT